MSCKILGFPTEDHLSFDYQIEQQKNLQPLATYIIIAKNNFRTLLFCQESVQFMFQRKN